jgi:hypothetical protein
MRVLLPDTFHVWMYGRFVDELKLGTEDLRAAKEAELAASGLARQDELTDGRTRTEREALLARRLAETETALTRLRGSATRERATEELAVEAESVARKAPTKELRGDALRLAADFRRLVSEGVQAETARMLREQRAAELADAERVRAEERKRIAEELRRDAERRATEASGTIVVEGGRLLLVAQGKPSLRLRSSRFRLIDYAGKTVRVEGRRLDTDAARDADGVFEVKHLEVLSSL